MIYTSLDTFYLTEEELANSPSRAEGVDAETETTLRIYGCELIQEAGILLRCSQAVMCTAQVVFQRFYCRKSMTDFNVWKLAAASVFLSTKLEESEPHINTREVLMVFDRILKRREGKSLSVLEPGSKEYDSRKEVVIRYERALLRTFGFIVHAEHPHKFVINYIQIFKMEHFEELADREVELRQLAWNVLNDSLRTMLCVRFKGEVVACGAIYFAARKLQIPLPEDPPWWLVFNVQAEQVAAVVATLVDLYQRPKAVYIEVGREALASKLRQQKHLEVAGSSPAKANSSAGSLVRPDLSGPPAPTATAHTAEATTAGAGGGGGGGTATAAAAIAAGEVSSVAAADGRGAADGASGGDRKRRRSRSRSRDDRADRDRSLHGRGRDRSRGYDDGRGRGRSGSRERGDRAQRGRSGSRPAAGGRSRSPAARSASRGGRSRSRSRSAGQGADGGIYLDRGPPKSGRDGFSRSAAERGERERYRDSRDGGGGAGKDSERSRARDVDGDDRGPGERGGTGRDRGGDRDRERHRSSSHRRDGESTAAHKSSRDKGGERDRDRDRDREKDRLREKDRERGKERGGSHRVKERDGGGGDGVEGGEERYADGDRHRGGRQEREREREQDGQEGQGMGRGVSTVKVDGSEREGSRRVGDSISPPPRPSFRAAASDVAAADAAVGGAPATADSGGGKATVATDVQPLPGVVVQDADLQQTVVEGVGGSVRTLKPTGAAALAAMKAKIASAFPNSSEPTVAGNKGSGAAMGRSGVSAAAPVAQGKVEGGAATAVTAAAASRMPTASSSRQKHAPIPFPAPKPTAAAVSKAHGASGAATAAAPTAAGSGSGTKPLPGAASGVPSGSRSSVGGPGSSVAARNAGPTNLAKASAAATAAATAATAGARPHSTTGMKAVRGTSPSLATTAPATVGAGVGNPSGAGGASSAVASATAAMQGAPSAAPPAAASTVQPLQTQPHEAHFDPAEEEETREEGQDDGWPAAIFGTGPDS